MLAGRHCQSGLSLVELMVAMLIAAMVITGAVRIAAGASASFRTQQNIGALQENARFAFEAMRREIAPAGYTPEPWNAGFSSTGISGETADDQGNHSDLLVVNRWSRKNCFENPNPQADAGGEPAWYLRETAFFLSASGSLSQRCRYGPDPSSLVTQINNQGLVNDALALQLLFAEDSDGDGNADRWVRAGNWLDEPGVNAVRIGLLLGTTEAIRASAPTNLDVLDETIAPSQDGRAYRVFETVVGLEGRQP